MIHSYVEKAKLFCRYFVPYQKKYVSILYDTADRKGRLASVRRTNIRIMC